MTRRTDPALILVTVALAVSGLVMVYSASGAIAAEQAGDSMKYFNRQLVALGIGLLVALAAAVTPTRTLRRLRGYLYVGVLLALALCFMPGIGRAVNGAHRWVGSGGLNLQPSEFAKVIVPIMAAHTLDRHRRRIGDWRVLLRAGLWMLPAALLILPEPDLGAVVVLGGTVFVAFWVAGARPRHLGALVGAGAALALPLVALEPYRVKRVFAFLDPWKDPAGAGYHTIQSLMAMHSGGLLGQGIGNSKAKLHFLPEPWTDNIGSVLAEELGLVGLVVLVLLYALFAWRGLTIARRARDGFGLYLAAALTGMVVSEAFVNLGVISGMLPNKGLVLPFMSYGASALISHLWLVGILLGIAAEADHARPEEGWPERRDARPVPAA